MSKITTILALLCISLNASAVSVSETGSAGQVLIFPYYNVNNNYITAFNIINTTEDTKAIKVRFRESKTSNDVLDFNLYMSPYDVFTMSLSKVEDGVLLETTDTTCTHPRIPVEGVEFRDVYDSVESDDILEGYLEVIEMGVVSDSLVAVGVEHVDGIPADCSVIEKAWADGRFNQGGAKSNTRLIDIVHSDSGRYPNSKSVLGYYGSDVVNGLSAPTGGIVGNSILVDTKNITAFVAEPTAINNYSTVAQHYLSSDYSFYLLPSLASGSVQGDWDLVARDWGLDDKRILPNDKVPTGINPMPIAEAMLVTSLGNQFFLGKDTHTDWVISQPMRKHGIYNDFMYIGETFGYTKGKDIPVAGGFGDINAPFGYWKNLNNEDVKATLVYYDREESSVTPERNDFSPAIEGEESFFNLDREVNVIAFTKGLYSDSTLGSNNADKLIIDSSMSNGWGLLSLNDYSLVSARYSMYWAKYNGNKDVLSGVPLHGFMAAKSGVGDGYVGETLPMFVTH